MDWVKKIVGSVEPIDDSIYGPQYRCSLTLRDGTFLPCAVIQSRDRLVEFARKQIREEMQRIGPIGSYDPVGQILSTFVAGRNRVNDYNVVDAAPSRFAIPLSLLERIHGETTMAWTGWVFRMKDKREFSYGSSYLTEFFELPDGYEFSDVDEVINHSFVNSDGELTRLEQGWYLPSGYPGQGLFSDRAFFSCAVDGI